MSIVFHLFPLIHCVSPCVCEKFPVCFYSVSQLLLTLCAWEVHFFFNFKFLRDGFVRFSGLTKLFSCSDSQMSHRCLLHFIASDKKFSLLLVYFNFFYDQDTPLPWRLQDFLFISASLQSACHILYIWTYFIFVLFSLDVYLTPGYFGFLVKCVVSFY